MELLSPTMAPNKKRNAGRQLLITRNRLKEETDQVKICSLRRLEASLLIELRQFDQAVSVAGVLAESGSGDGSGAAFYADILARTGKWRLAEKQFTIARDRCLSSGRQAKARSLEQGPLYIMAEARKDAEKCMALASTPVLRERAARRSGELVKTVSSETASPWKELALLERVHNGETPKILTGILNSWSAGEGEWRWRILFEGAMLCSEAGHSMKQWRKYLRNTGTNILDPRYHSERKVLKKLFSGDFVKKDRQ